MAARVAGFLRFVAIGSFFALTSEFLYKFLARFNPGAFMIALVFWPLFVASAFFASKLLEAVLKKRLWVEVSTYLASGLLGLMIEWNVLGNSPSGNPNASQLTMFSIWASAVVAPRLLLCELEGLERLKRQMRTWFGLYLAVSLVGVFFPHPLRALWVFVLSMLGYIGLHLFYLRFFVALAKHDR